MIAHHRRVALISATCALLLSAAASAQTVTIGQATPPTSLDPHFHNHAQNNANSAHVFEALFGRSARMQLEPGLALSARPLDATTWEVKLRPDVLFHDGTPFTADDVAFSLQRSANVPNSPGSFNTFTRQVASVQVVDPLTLRIVTKATAPLLLDDLSNIYIVSRRHGEGAATDDYNSGKAMIGTGPYRFASWRPGGEVAYTRNERHWGPRQAWERAVFRIIPNNAARVAALLAGDVDMIADIPTTDVERLKADQRFTVFTVASNRLVFLAFDRTDDALTTGHIRAADGGRPARNPLGDVRVRRALSMAIDRRAIVERINQGEAVLAPQFLPEGFFGHLAGIQPQPHDPEAARRLLAEAGYPGGFRLTLSTSNDRIINSGRMVQAIAQMWSRIGVQTEVELMPHAVFTPRRTRLELPVFLSSWGNSTGEALYTLVPQLGTRSRETGLGSANRIRYSNPDLDRLLIAAGRELDREKRLGLIEQATRIALAEEIMPPLLFQVNNWGARRGIHYEARVDQYTLVMGASRR
ncbi:MAG: ABC transporter substrate-binding protein [Alphaproteobacteria bacterium]|nr:ABC transporter substrate-binding protein [Alphaproteobacteria bacterium]